jgi:hypothetical protein
MTMTQSGKTSTTYLYQHYFDETALKRFAIEEFVKAMRRGRVIAFVGSMATVGYGYPDWNALLDLSIKASKTVLLELLPKSEEDTAAIEFKDFTDKLLSATKANNFDARVMTSAIGGWIDHKTERQDGGEKVNAELAKLLRDKKPSDIAQPEKNMVAALLAKLGIRRFVTTNYDMEIEYDLLEINDSTIFDRNKKLLDRLDLDDDLPTQLRLPMDDGNLLMSDAFQRERLDRLVEFAVGSAEVDYRVLHLHGRIDKPKTMVVSYRDYDRLYRVGGPTKLPFEQALNMLYVANPVLFVGLGMKEPELNKTLEEMVGNQPYRRAVQAFLLWNAPLKLKNGALPEIIVDEDAKAMFRLDKLHRLGVLTIFDDELEGGLPRGLLGDDVRDERVTDAIVRLDLSVQAVRKDREDKINSEDWRNSEFKRDINAEPAIFTWHFARDYPSAEGGLDVLAQIEGIAPPYLKVQTARPGKQKSGLATATVRRWCYGNSGETAQLNRHALFINTSLRLDTDSVLELMRKFLVAHSKSQPEQEVGREQMFRDGKMFHSSDKELLIVFKGLERLFSKTGVPLSAEFDRFFRDYLVAAIAHNKANDCKDKFCRIVVYGTRRMRLYFQGLEEQVGKAMTLGKSKEVLRLERDDEQPYGYLVRLREVAINGNSNDTVETEKPPLAGDRAYARKTYSLFFASEKFRDKFKAGSPDEKLAFAVMTVMAFIGQPVEREVLFHAPRILDKFVSTETLDKRVELDAIIDNLTELKLLHIIANPTFTVVPESKNEANADTNKRDHRPRYALHLTLQAEMRERYGVPLSEAVLSTSFNMSLFAAQPSDSAMPDPVVHDELAKLIDWMIGAYKDREIYNSENDAFEDDASEEERRTPFHVSCCLRAALAVIRGFYSTSSLLSIDRDDRIASERRDGALTEHADRIERLIRAFHETRKQRAKKRAELGDGAKDIMGPEAIYPDELVWLHNERGVVKLAQGDMYEARMSLNEADRINRAHVEYQDRSHNWRRIWLNQVVVDLERGKLAEAEDRLGRIENSVGRGVPSESDRIRVSWRNESVVNKISDDLTWTHEDKLSVALAAGYRGLCMQLRGELNPADHWYTFAINMLEKLDEQRACALFRRHHGSLQDTLFGSDKMVATAKLSVAGAESVQQMDIAYSARIMRNKVNANSERAEDRRKAMRTFIDALDYATITDVHRVAIEARKALAGLKLANGDYESALDHAWQGLGLAARYGMSLHKISIRILIGKILYARDNREAGLALIQSAIREADRMGYQRAVESAQSALAEISGW